MRANQIIISFKSANYLFLLFSSLKDIYYSTSWQKYVIVVCTKTLKIRKMNVFFVVVVVLVIEYCILIVNLNQSDFILKEDRGRKELVVEYKKKKSIALLCVCVISGLAFKLTENIALIL